MSETSDRDNRDWIAACGLDCEACEIRRLSFDETAAGICIKWYREMGWLKDGERVAEAIERGMTCHGCKGDRSIHWSVDKNEICWILACCVDQRGHAFCSDCRDFPCDKLVAWSKSDTTYANAFRRLQAMHGEPNRPTRSE